MSEVMSKFDIPWFAMCRADTSKETWKKMADYGCQGVKRRRVRKSSCGR